MNKTKLFFTFFSYVFLSIFRCNSCAELQIFMRGLDFFMRGLDFLMRGLDFLMRGLDFFMRGLDFFMRSLDFPASAMEKNSMTGDSQRRAETKIQEGENFSVIL